MDYWVSDINSILKINKNEICFFKINILDCHMSSFKYRLLTVNILIRTEALSPVFQFCFIEPSKLHVLK